MMPTVASEETIQCKSTRIPFVPALGIAEETTALGTGNIYLYFQ
jgi:hypothetical protein